MYPGITVKTIQMNPIPIKAQDKQYFDEAESIGEVYGTYHRYINNQWTCFYIFAWLGRQVSDQCREINGTTTRFKRFVNCTIRISLTQELLDEEKFLEEIPGITIDLFYL